MGVGGEAQIVSNRDGTLTARDAAPEDLTAPDVPLQPRVRLVLEARVVLRSSLVLRIATTRPAADLVLAKN
jgi:hypothetical protein